MHKLEESLENLVDYLPRRNDLDELVAQIESGAVSIKKLKTLLLTCVVEVNNLERERTLR